MCSVSSDQVIVSMARYISQLGKSRLNHQPDVFSKFYLIHTLNKQYHVPLDADEYRAVFDSAMVFFSWFKKTLQQ